MSQASIRLDSSSRGEKLSKYLSLFRWAGAKKSLIPKIQTDSIGCSRYIEPFLGSAVVLLNLDNHITCIGGDENQELIETLQSIRDLPEPVISGTGDNW